ncbi:MAG: LysM peptidoglycan-binding domain-containing protein [Puniceicoccales bacterium]|jgi:LysM repeat protein|nr:LysM peptidoglycan-binding domain-containing protein [Puniceicoccales bacterium]
MAQNLFFSIPRIPSLLLLAFFLLAGTACERSAEPVAHLPETEDPAYKQAQALLRSEATANDNIALEKFQQVIDARLGDAPESHLEAGRLCLKQNQPLDACYHFKQFLRFKRDSGPLAKQQTRQVEELIRSAEKMFLQKIPGRPIDLDGDRSGLAENYQSLRQENDLLKRQNVDLQKRLAAARAERQQNTTPANIAEAIPPIAMEAAKAPPPSPAVVSNIPTTYTVKKGDTLMKVSIQVYGTSARWLEIRNANRDLLPSDEAKLQIGMVLKVPR